MVAWRVFHDRFPTADALARRNIPVATQVCSICETNIESIDHLFTGCPKFMDVWQLVFSWCRVPSFFAFHARDLLSYHLTAKNGARVRKAFYAVVLTTFWSIWRARNNHVFNHKQVWVRKIMEEIKVMSYLWITNRSRMADMSWDSWVDLMQLKWDSLGFLYFGRMYSDTLSQLLDLC
ncbi:putative reverse transcriptase zinc-binding domain-containing protein [Helianthus annuus]|uniref:Reverse transcriptase zinc-binding domain-containing protein n=2 Tax=Helianthus annuus TaxID=4232 RepID=A0A9K3I4R9_HELAN|nr:putative reverse transcriptase zinc-binding domain-containing protein [Helianthus annuus]KAJ0533639.1 putative reverse transcriptase zinc-binding domain-containing protein [Helianthus annuus]KAJ0892550.1 putative reverse transcriptase zinc-binding domain-containing protein [Helianthus annuus]